MSRRDVERDKMHLRRLLTSRGIPWHGHRLAHKQQAQEVVRRFLERPRAISSIECDALVEEWVG